MELILRPDIKSSFNIDRAKIVNDNKIFKKLNSDIWEFRTLYNKKQYRLFAFWYRTDKTRSLVIATHGIIKKTQKTPRKEIEKARNAMLNYIKSKGEK